MPQPSQTHAGKRNACTFSSGICSNAGSVPQRTRRYMCITSGTGRERSLGTTLTATSSRFALIATTRKILRRNSRASRTSSLPEKMPGPLRSEIIRTNRSGRFEQPPATQFWVRVMTFDKNDNRFELICITAMNDEKAARKAKDVRIWQE